MFSSGRSLIDSLLSLVAGKRYADPDHVFDFEIEVPDHRPAHELRQDHNQCDIGKAQVAIVIVDQAAECHGTNDFFLHTLIVIFIPTRRA